MTPFFYVRTIEKCIIALLDVFNNVRINKYTDISRTSYTKTVHVPIVTHNSSNFANWVSTTKTTKPLLPVPIFGLRYENMVYDEANRIQPMYLREIFSKATEQWFRTIQPTPYAVTFKLTALCDNMSDFNQIKENIIPYFNKYLTIKIKEFDFIPDLERPIQVELTNIGDKIEDEVKINDSTYQWYTVDFSLVAHLVLYRPFAIPEMIKYAQMNFNIDESIIHSEQIIAYPNEIAEQKRNLWETVEESIRDGYSLLKTLTRTLVKRGTVNNEDMYDDATIQTKYLTPNNEVAIGKDANGNPLYQVVVDDVERPIEVPSFDLLHLTFDYDTGNEVDYSGFNRDFVAINDDGRTFVPDMYPVNGQNTPDGYDVSPSVDWSRILNWFGDNATGVIESPYTFKATIQFKDDIVGDTIFQYLSNIETTLSDGTVISADTVWFDWGILDSKLYFTYHTSSMYKTFVSSILTLDKETIYSFYFVLYKKGEFGIFGMKNNLSDIMIVLDTKEDVS